MLEDRNPNPPGSSVWFMPLPGFHQVAIAGGHEELIGRCRELVDASAEGDARRMAVNGANALLAMVGHMFGKGVCYLATGLFLKDNGEPTTATLSLSVLDAELPDGGATSLALAGVIEAKWGCDPTPVDVPAGPAMAWSEVIRPSLVASPEADPTAAPPPELPEVHQMHIAVVHPEGRRFAVLQCSTTDADEVDSYRAMLDLMATTIWFDGESPYFRQEPEPTGAGPDFRSVLG